jgi:hypothetical protein
MIDSRSIYVQRMWNISKVLHLILLIAQDQVINSETLKILVYRTYTKTYQYCHHICIISSRRLLAFIYIFLAPYLYIICLVPADKSIKTNAPPTIVSEKRRQANY